MTTTNDELAEVERSMYVRLLKPRQARARAIAAAHGVTVVALYAGLIERYAEGTPKPKRRGVPREQRTMTEVPVSVDVYRRATARSSEEGKPISTVIDEMLNEMEVEA